MMPFPIIFSTLLLCLFTLPILSSSQEVYIHSLSQSTASLRLWTTTPSARAFKNLPIPTATASEVKVYSARNEFEPFVIVVNPTSTTDVPVIVPGFPTFAGNSDIVVELFHVQNIHLSSASDDIGVEMGCDGGSGCDVPDILWPIDDGDSISCVGNENTAIWFLLHVKDNVAGGQDYTTSVSVGGISIPIRLHVFDFMLSKELHVKGQMNFAWGPVLNAYGIDYNERNPETAEGQAYWAMVEAIHTDFLNRRLVPKRQLFPDGISYSADSMDCETMTIPVQDDPWRVTGWSEGNPDEAVPSKLLETGIGGVTYPNVMVHHWIGQGSGVEDRPDEICGVQRQAEDWRGDVMSPYNQMYFGYIKALQDRLILDGWVERVDGASLPLEGQGKGFVDVYHYIWDEPTPEGASYLAWYTQESKRVAPHLRLTVTDPPSELYYENEEYPLAKVDAWIPCVAEFSKEGIAEKCFGRMVDCQEDIWIYFLAWDGILLNAITIDHPAIDGKLLGMYYWKYRFKGILYYAWATWDRSDPYGDPSGGASRNGGLFLYYPPAKDNNPIVAGSNGNRMVPSIRLEMYRDGLEDYEYLFVLNGGPPEPDNQGTMADRLAFKLLPRLTRFERDDEFSYNLRRLIGLYNGGEISSIPFIEPPKPTHPRASLTTPTSEWNWYLNFQDPADEPLADPLVVDGHEWMKIGWEQQFAKSPYSVRLPLDAPLGYGWVPVRSHDPVPLTVTRYEWRPSGANDLFRSVLYDFNGWPKNFYFVVPRACYTVTVGIGFPGRTYEHNSFTVMDTLLYDDVVTTDQGSLVRSTVVCVYDYLLRLLMGTYEGGEFAMLNYMSIEYASALPEDEEPYIPVVPQRMTDRMCSFGNRIVFGWSYYFSLVGGLVTAAVLLGFAVVVVVICAVCRRSPVQEGNDSGSFPKEEDFPSKPERGDVSLQSSVGDGPRRRPPIVPRGRPQQQQYTRSRPAFL